MAVSAADSVRTVRSMSGRVRVHLPFWDGSGEAELERQVRRLKGVVDASARSSTGNLLIRFAPQSIDEAALLRALRKLAPRAGSRAPNPETQPDPEPEVDPDAEPLVETPEPAQPWFSPAPLWATAGRFTASLREQAGRFGRARIAVRGIDRDPELARRVVAALERRPDVRRAVASATTGRVMVEFSERVTSLQDLLTELSQLELPETPGEDRPAHPLDPTPVIQSGARLAGSTLGLGMLGAQRIFGLQPQGRAVQAPAVAAGIFGLIDGTPPIRDELRERLGRDRAQLLLSSAAIVSLTLSGSPLGLLVSGAGALRLFTEARARRNAWREYERRVSDATEAQPGAVVRLETGARVPLHSRVVEGTGTVIGGDGLPDGARPGTRLEAGARVLSGPLVVELLGGRAWTPEPRPCPPRPDAPERYLTAIAPVSLAYALLLAAARRSPAAAFTGLLLVNPRAALIGSEAADTGASARALRAGVTVVGTRPERQIRRPDVLLIDGPRVLAAGLEQGSIVPVGPRDRAELTALVSAMLTASGSPWGPGLGLSGTRRATRAQFDGSGVTATIDGRELWLGPPEPDDHDQEPVIRAIEAGEQPLVLRALDSGQTIAHVRLRPKLAPGIEQLRRRCQEHGVELLVLERDDRRASRALARRAEIPLVVEADLTDLVRDRQRVGERVAVLSDTPAAAEAFEACDLAIGLSSGRSSVFQARADLLAPGLPAVASVITAGARNDQASTAAVGLSVAANLAGAWWGLQGEPGVTRASHTTYLGALGALGVSWQRLRGGRQARSVISRLTDPRPERWGQIDPAQVLTATQSRLEGLRSQEADERRAPRQLSSQPSDVMVAIREQLESPLVAVLGAGAAISLAAGAVA
ncbi:MAG: hypothetical protein JO244_06385, partial [Solirubrobacterales bacterium]|nr:hypothetical protein [Solirubrobacterales bacterium]